MHRHVGHVCVFQRGRRIAVPEQPADGQHRLALRQGHAGVGVSAIVKADVAQIRLRPHASPSAVERPHTQAAAGLRRGEDPDCAAGHAVENLTCGRREPDRARSHLAVRQEQLALAVVAPFESDDLALAASGEQQQAYDRHELWVIGFMTRQDFAQPAEFRRREEALPPLTPVALIPLQGLVPSSR